MGGIGIFLHRPIAAFLIVLTVTAVVVAVRLLSRVPKGLVESDPGM
jgi:hypothetical protein